MVALGQRRLSIGLGILLAVIVIASIAIAAAASGGSGGRGGGAAELQFVVQVVALFVTIYMTAATYQLSRALGHARGLRITLACAVLIVPFASLIVPPLLLGLAKRMLRAHAIEAGFFTVRRDAMNCLRQENGLAMICPGCGYDLTGIGDRPICPECGRSRE